MPRIKLAEHGGTKFERLLGHNIEIQENWSKLGESLNNAGQLSPKLKEQVRRTLAQQNGCEYCRAKGKPDQVQFDEQVTVAVGFAEVFIKMKGTVSASIIEVLKETFSESEISELCAFITFTTASQYIGAMLGLEAET
ncbi:MULTISPECIES: carboxymuconolactone decarboxylase family protein [Exiguobacterium]|uniref:carboxymuconolactone decarboxylase family protein n=1 Tax=Exiguobacterium TaxID=33986 RepID=UPI00064B2DED|nr:MULTISPECIES: carboxymuconolactone decarboxylase family protein [unclassified Exiguobacterium]QLQ21379.1 MAG: carboxymuconolactone decarboxylase family protein [Paracoccaceae bacterium]